MAAFINKIAFFCLHNIFNEDLSSGGRCSRFFPPGMWIPNPAIINQAAVVVVAAGGAFAVVAAGAAVVVINAVAVVVAAAARVTIGCEPVAEFDLNFKQKP